MRSRMAYGTTPIYGAETHVLYMRKAGFPSNATHVTHARKYVTNAMNAMNATHVRIASSSQ